MRPANSNPADPRSTDPEESESALRRALYGTLRTEARRDGLWNVQPVSPASAVKEYVCPGCGQSVPPGQAHVVAWRADGLLGEAADVAARRHWHTHCWKVS
jgi:hypothetical protein